MKMKKYIQPNTQALEQISLFGSLMTSIEDGDPANALAPVRLPEKGSTITF